MASFENCGRGVSRLVAVIFLIYILSSYGDVVAKEITQVLKFKINNEADLGVLQGLHGDYWTGVRANVDIRVAVQEHEVDRFISRLKSKDIKPEVEIHDLDEYLKRKKLVGMLVRKEALPTLKPGFLDWKRWWPLPDIHAFLERIASENADVATVINIGKSYEGRDLLLIKIGYPPSSGECVKAGYFIDAGIHAREWAAPATATYLINELITKKKKHKELLELMDFYIIPSANPDGYSFTWTGLRMWRKTRSNAAGEERPQCIGVDPNRNFDYKYGGEGTSGDPCEITYRGKGPFSEAETMAIRDFVTKKRGEGVDWVIYTAIHSYGQVILYPWGYAEEPLGDAEKLKKVAKIAQEAVKGVHGKDYEIGGAAELMGAGAGGSDDWAKGSGIFEYAYTFEVRPSMSSPGAGFLLPEEEIQGTGEEVSAGILAMASYVASIR